MAKSEFIGHHYQCDACGKEVEGRGDHDEKFKGWSEIHKMDVFYGHPQCKILCPLCSDLHDLTLAETFSWPDPTNPPIISAPDKLPEARLKNICRRCNKDTNGKGIKKAGHTAGKWEGVHLCTNCRTQLNDEYTAVKLRERNLVDHTEKQYLDGADPTDVQLPCDSL